VSRGGVEVRLEDLRRRYAGVVALDGLSLTLAPGELVADPRQLRLPANLSPGRYHIQVGWYLPATGARLPTVPPAPDDALTLEERDGSAKPSYDVTVTAATGARLPGLPGTARRVPPPEG